MVIIEREGKYFLQLTNGELELSEKQAKNKLEKGAVLKEDVDSEVQTAGPVVPQTALQSETLNPVQAQTQAHQSEEVETNSHTDIFPQVEHSEPMADSTPNIEQSGEEEFTADAIWETGVDDTSDTQTGNEKTSTIWDQPAEIVEPQPENPAHAGKAFEDPVIQVKESIKQEEPVLQEEPVFAEEEPQKAHVAEKPQHAGRASERRRSHSPSRPNSQLLPVNKVPNTAESFILSDEYYDSIIREFERVYVANDRKDETALELLEYCQKSINHLKIERAQPNADLALLDYQRLGWLRIIVFLQALTGVAAPRHESGDESRGKPEKEKDIIRQMLVIQLLQETGAFPYADALKSITHDNIVGLIARILNKEKSLVKTSMQRSGDILLRRNVSPMNAAKRLKLLTEVENYFSELPYNHVIIRLKSLKEFYKNYHLK